MLLAHCRSATYEDVACCAAAVCYAVPQQLCGPRPPRPAAEGGERPGPPAPHAGRVSRFDVVQSMDMATSGRHSATYTLPAARRCAGGSVVLLDGGRSGVGSGLLAARCIVPVRGCSSGGTLAEAAGGRRMFTQRRGFEREPREPGVQSMCHTVSDFKVGEVQTMLAQPTQEAPSFSSGRFALGCPRHRSTLVPGPSPCRFAAPRRLRSRRPLPPHPCSIVAPALYTLPG